jgi:two-component system sensor histidine kinase KdpD
MKNQSRMRYVYTLMIVGGATLIAKLLLPYFAPANLVMIYLLAVVFISTQFGRGPAVLASIISVCIFDFFCIEPFLTFAVSDSQYVLTFFVMLTTALVISNLTATARDQAERAMSKEHQTSLLYSFSRELAAGPDLNALAEIGRKHINQLVGAKTEVLMFEPNSGIGGKLGANTITPESMNLIAKALEDKSNGRTIIAHSTKVIPFRQSSGRKELLGAVVFEEGLSQCDQERLATLESFVNQLGLACERARLSEENEQARVQVKSEKLRSSLLSSISHDLRTPLATITGAASGIMESGADVNLSECKALATEIFDESRRLNRLVGNLLDMTRVESGALEIHKEPQPVDEIIGSVIAYFSDQLTVRNVETDIPEEPPMVLGDAVLIQQLLINLMENIFKYTPADSPILFRAVCPGADKQVNGQDFVTIEVSDRGPGIPEDLKKQVFQKFVRAKSTSSTSGAGLGLAICQGIVEAHGGKIGVKDREGGGATFWFTLPIDHSVDGSGTMVDDNALEV